MARKIVCPNRKCKSVNVYPLDKKTNVSLVGAAIGGAVAGPVGALIGAVANGKGSKVKFRCAECGTVFDEKL